MTIVDVILGIIMLLLVLCFVVELGKACLVLFCKIVFFSLESFLRLSFCLKRVYCYIGFLSDCEDLVAPLHGSLSLNAVSHGEFVIVSCLQGYTLSGERTLVCSYGNLSAKIGTCEASE